MTSKVVRWLMVVVIVAGSGSTLAVASTHGDPTLPEVEEYGHVQPTVLTYSGPTTADYHDEVTLQGTLSAGFPPEPLEGKTLRLRVGSVECTTPPTNAEGKASCTITVADPPGTATAVAVFDGDDDYLPSSGIAPFEITKQDTAVDYTGPTSFGNGQPGTLSGKLTEEGGAAIADRELDLSLGSQSCTGTTDTSGAASCTIASVNQPAGTVTASVTFAGDSLYEPSSTSEDVTVGIPTVLTYTGDTAADYHDDATLSGTLAESESGAAIGGRAVKFGLGSSSCNAFTDDDGNASCTVSVAETPGSHTATAHFAGDDTYQPSSASAPFTVTREETAAEYTGPATFTASQAGTLSGRLTEEGVAPIADRQLTFSLGSGASAQSCTGTTDASGAASCTLASVEQPAGTTTASVEFAGDTFYEPSSASKAVSVLIPTRLRYTGDTTADYHDDATLAATLTDARPSGGPVSGRTVEFTLGSGSCSGVTDASGSASCTVTIDDAPGPYSASANFAGDSTYRSSSDSAAFEVTRQETSVAYTGPAGYASGAPATLTGNLGEEDGSVPIEGRTVTFALGSQQCSDETDATGEASCTIASVNHPPGAATVTTTFTGDAFYEPSGDRDTVYSYTKTEGGSFVVGDLSSTGSLFFWGSEWSKHNTLSGGAAPKQFKGFSLGSATCDEAWNTGPGSSPPPPATVPEYTAMIVASRITSASETIKGDTADVVIVRTDPGYGPTPEQPGTGTALATLC